MSANPLLQGASTDRLLPVPYAGEVVALRRDSIDIALDGVRTASGTWKVRGYLFLTSLRLVFISGAADESGLQAFDLPLAYLRRVKFNQPIFGCNNLAGECWPAQPGGGPLGSLPPHKFALYFKEGGVGTFLPLYFNFLESAQAAARLHQSTLFTTQQSQINMVATALVDPSDPSQLILTQPSSGSDLPSAPVYAANFGEDEVYESMDGPSRR